MNAARDQAALEGRHGSARQGGSSRQRATQNNLGRGYLLPLVFPVFSTNVSRILVQGERFLPQGNFDMINPDMSG